MAAAAAAGAAPAAAAPARGAAAASTLEPGTMLLVRYDDADLWHMRLVLAEVGGGRWMILTADGDLYSEEYTAGNMDITGCRVLGRPRRIPANLGGMVYGWDAGTEPSGAELADLIEEAKQLAVLEGGVAAAGDRETLVWVYKEGGPNHAVGDIVEEMDGVTLGSRGLKSRDGQVYVVEQMEEAAVKALKAATVTETDARVMDIVYDGVGERKRGWQDVSTGIQECAMESFPVSGPRTAAGVTRFFSRRGTGPVDHHRWWRSTARLAGTDLGVQEHSLMCKVLELAGCYDQLDICNLASMESVARRLETIEYQYRERVRDNDRGSLSGGGSLAGQSAITADEMDLFDGMGHVAATVCCAPSLVEHVASELEKEARIHKEARKAREERALLRTTTPAGGDESAAKGGGKKK